MRPVIVIHYNEIALKGRNRDRFERQLIANIRSALREVLGCRVQRMSGRIVLRIFDTQLQAPNPELLARLVRTFGIANIQTGYEVRQGREELTEDVVGVAMHRLRDASCRTFAVRVKRGNKTYPTSSQDLERLLGAAIGTAAGLRVDLEHPDCTVAVEIVERTAFVLTERVIGAGGLPVGVSGRVVNLLSSGFDSPVAAWMLMKRGCTVTFVHAHSYPYTSDASIQNVRAMVGRLANWQGPGMLVTVPIVELQKVILTTAPHALRILLYRRAMVRLAELVARRVRAGALVTGENLGQVASQTLPNIAAVGAASTIPILRPLIGFDKQEIIARADAIGTGEISRRPYDDCCSLFTPTQPATASTAAELERVEDTLRCSEWILKVFSHAVWEIIPQTTPTPSGASNA